MIGVRCAANPHRDWQTLTAAITASHSGDTIAISGICLLTRTLVLPGSRTYTGAKGSGGSRRLGTDIMWAAGAARGSAAPLLASDSWAENEMTSGYPITIENLTIDGNRSGNPDEGDGLVIRSYGSVIRNLDISDFTGNCLTVTSVDAAGAVVTNTEVNGAIQFVQADNCAKNGIEVQDPGNAVTDWYMLDNWALFNGADGIDIENAAGWTVEGNHVGGQVGDGIAADRLYATTIADNYVEGFNATGSDPSAAGIRATLRSTASHPGSIISGNRVFHFDGTGGTYIELDQIGTGPGVAAVFGNLIDGDGTGTGFGFTAPSGSMLVTSSADSVNNVATPRTTSGQVTIGSGI